MAFKDISQRSKDLRTLSDSSEPHLDEDKCTRTRKVFKLKILAAQIMQKLTELAQSVYWKRPRKYQTKQKKLPPGLGTVAGRLALSKPNWAAVSAGTRKHPGKPAKSCLILGHNGARMPDVRKEKDCRNCLHLPPIGIPSRPEI